MFILSSNIFLEIFIIDWIPRVSLVFQSWHFIVLWIIPASELLFFFLKSNSSFYNNCITRRYILIFFLLNCISIKHLTSHISICKLKQWLAVKMLHLTKTFIPKFILLLILIIFTLFIISFFFSIFGYNLLSYLIIVNSFLFL